jgi:hypothetical protein
MLNKFQHDSDILNIRRFDYGLWAIFDILTRVSFFDNVLP